MTQQLRNVIYVTARTFLAKLDPKAALSVALARRRRSEQRSRREAEKSSQLVDATVSGRKRTHALQQMLSALRSVALCIKTFFDPACNPFGAFATDQ
jgi:hypothetical protein